MNENEATQKTEQVQKEIIKKIKDRALNPTWENLCKYFPEKHRLEDKPPKYEPDPDLWLFTYGNKAIMTRVTETQDFISCIDYLQKQKAEKKDKETTLISKAVKQKMQELANEKQKPVEYNLMTANLNMAKWAVTSGKEILGLEDKDIKITHFVENEEDKGWKEITSEDLIKLEEGERINITCKSTLHPNKE